MKPKLSEREIKARQALFDYLQFIKRQILENVEDGHSKYGKQRVLLNEYHKSAVLTKAGKERWDKKNWLKISQKDELIFFAEDDWVGYVFKDGSGGYIMWRRLKDMPKYYRYNEGLYGKEWKIHPNLLEAWGGGSPPIWNITNLVKRGVNFSSSFINWDSPPWGELK